LAWFLAFQFCKRFYASHGVVPYVIAKEGLGYYGIGLDYLPCSVNGKDKKHLGRITMQGNVENWRTGGPGDHGCDLVGPCEAGLPTEELVRRAIRHMDIPPLPEKSHLPCRHKRWGDSYVLMFEVATILALRSREGLHIWNFHAEEEVRRLDPTKADMAEHPGVFTFEFSDKKVVVAGDGRVLDGSSRNLWKEYITGDTPKGMATSIEKNLFRD
jgi:hypothetical protein